jgi:hypothetical protein
MPTKREREYYRMGFFDGQQSREEHPVRAPLEMFSETPYGLTGKPKPKRRKLSAWNKFVKANSKKPRFILRSGKLNLKKMGVAFRKTPAGKKKRR